MRKTFRLAVVVAVGLAGFGYGLPSGAAETRRSGDHTPESYVRVPMPPGFQVMGTELEGPVFADARGRTLYTWPVKAMRNGYAGDSKGKSACGDTVILKSAGLMSPYPPGLALPEYQNRLSCVAYWPPAYAGDDAKAVGNWTVITREDGKKQWAYDGQALYTSILDRAPGDVMGGSGIARRGDSPAARMPAGPPSALPPGFRVSTTVRGRMLMTDTRYSVYQSDADGANKSNCVDDCARTWLPILAPHSAQAQGEWSIVDRGTGVRQWAFRKKPLYTYIGDDSPGRQDGADVAGWRNVYTQVAPPAPQGFTVQTGINGDVLADSRGRTVYVYNCGEDSVDMMPCDTVDGPQQHRLAVCGNGDLARCLRMWPYVEVAPGAKSETRLWSTVWIDPNTGHRAAAGQPGALHVWAYRDRPIYTYAGDREPGDFEGNAVGEFQGYWNGYRAFWIRDIGARG